MEKHKVIHLKGSSVYKCDQCARAFNFLHHLNRHKERHQGERYQCKYCDRTYTRKDVLKVHMVKRHRNF